MAPFAILQRMDRIKLIKPAESMKPEVMKYRDEFLNEHEAIHGSGSLDKAASFEEWLISSKNTEKEETTPEGWVPATQYLAFTESDNRLVGMIQVRHILNDYLLREGGHIGYSVRKSERRKGYATQMLREALHKCKDLDINRVLITCDADNLGSAAVIKGNGGILENKITSEDGQMMDRYWIEIFNYPGDQGGLY